eukprot:g4415.t1
MGVTVHSTAPHHDEDDPLEAKLNSLRWRLRQQSPVDATESVVPFIEIIKSTTLGGLVKQAALSALLHLFRRVINRNSPRIGPAVNAVTDAAIHLQISMASSDLDELVLSSVLDLLMQLLQTCGELLTDEVMWDTSNCIFGLHERRRASPLLRYRAEEALLVLFETVFSRCSSIIVNTPSDDGDEAASHSATLASANSSPSPAEFRPHGLPVAIKLLHFATSLVDVDQHEALRTSIGLQHNNYKDKQVIALQTLGMKLINEMICCAGSSLNASTATLTLIKDDLCRNVIRAAFSTDMMLVCASLEAFQHLLAHYRQHLKSQVAMIFKYVYLKELAEQTKNPGNVRLRTIDETAKSSTSNPIETTKLIAAKMLARNLMESDEPNDVPGPRYSFSYVISADMSELRALRAHKIKLRKAVNLFNAKPKHGIRELERIGFLLPVDGGMSIEQRALVIADFLRHTTGLEKARIGEFLGGGESKAAQAIRQCYVDTFNVSGQSTVSSLRMFLGAFRLPGEAQQIDRILQTFAKNVFKSSADKDLFATADVAYLLSFSIIMLNTDLHNPNIKPERKMTLSQFVATNKDYGDDVSQGRVLPLDFLVSIYNSIKSSEFETHKGKPGGNGENTVVMKAPAMTVRSSWSAVISDDEWRDMLLCSNGQEIRYYTGSSVQTGHQIQGNNTEYCQRDVFQIVHRSVSSAMTVVLETAPVNGGMGIEDALEGFILLSRGAVFFEMPSLLDQVLVTLKQSMGLPQVLSPLPKQAATSNSSACLPESEAQERKQNLSEGTALGSSPPSTSSSLATPHLLALSRRPESLLSFGRNLKAHMACMAFFGVFRQFSDSIGVTGWDAMLRVLIGMWQLGMLPQSMLIPQPMLGSTDAHLHFLAVAKAARSRAQSEYGLQRSTSSGLFSWLFAASDEEAEGAHYGLVFGEDAKLSLSQRLDLGPISLEELTACAKERSDSMSAAARTSAAGTQPRTLKHRQDVNAVYTAVRCIAACQLTPALLCPRVAMTDQQDNNDRKFDGHDDSQFSATEAEDLLFELHRRSLILIKKFSLVEDKSRTDDAQTRKIDSCMLLVKALQDEHKNYLTGEQIRRLSVDNLKDVLLLRRGVGHTLVELNKILALTGLSVIPVAYFSGNAQKHLKWALWSQVVHTLYSTYKYYGDKVPYLSGFPAIISELSDTKSKKRRLVGVKRLSIIFGSVALGLLSAQVFIRDYAVNLISIVVLASALIHFISMEVDFKFVLQVRTTGNWTIPLVVVSILVLSTWGGSDSLSWTTFD